MSDTPADSSRSLRLAGLFGLAVALFWVVIGAYSVKSALPPTALSLPHEKEMKLSALQTVPQGWAFFTISPRRPVYFAYQHTARGWESALLSPHSRPRNAFGLDRLSRAQAAELGVLQYQLQDKDWYACNGRPIDACLAAAPVPRTIHNAQPHPVTCGDAALAEQEPVPWAWSRDTHQHWHVLKVARVMIRC
ncbi:SdpA family antimicrobial peptide system protein [Actinomadura bangladeshensis]|uniref:SdpA family antimicrobial peptide system protein n=1 Tax=Actinomadura bangladeshensis TaxID=453573 RepID=A0A4V2XNY8_9ACTN|nr:SdpA family antimicrobial peptide system protein [Actinomadura bangladeshensis]TDC20036.1 SdpA family antimicrobial peptide system protein [Actinomadura bangladeshensis]